MCVETCCRVKPSGLRDAACTGSRRKHSRSQTGEQTHPYRSSRATRRAPLTAQKTQKPQKHQTPNTAHITAKKNIKTPTKTYK